MADVLTGSPTGPLASDWRGRRGGGGGLVWGPLIHPSSSMGMGGAEGSGGGGVQNIESYHAPTAPSLRTWP